ncbi:MAG: 6-phosphogluconolactonase [Dehalococcoidia bacterium]|nr:6-phosphogluconolactonase [Dehalococcoidia bacterium]
MEIAILPDVDAVALATANIVAASSLAAGDEFSIALAGGETPRRLYEMLATEPFLSGIAWDTWNVWWGDERCVPPTDEMNNYALAAESLLSKVPIPAERVHRIRGEVGSQAAAVAYENELRDHFGGGNVPEFDLILLGVGDDGHTASLFPGTQALQETRQFVVPSVAPWPPYDRLTLSLPVINAARRVVFIVVGREKAHALRMVIASDREDAQQPPAALVRPANGVVQFVVDEAAAVLLTGAPA